MRAGKQNLVFGRAWFFPVLITSLAVAILDGLAAVISAGFHHNISPSRVFQYIASGLMDQNAYTAGWVSTGVGLFLHWLISFIWSCLFFLLYPNERLTATWKVFGGIVMGLAIYLIMSEVVVPLSHIGVRAAPATLEHALIHILLVGMPISFSAARFREKQHPSERRRTNIALNEKRNHGKR